MSRFLRHPTIQLALVIVAAALVGVAAAPSPADAVVERTIGRSDAPSNKVRISPPRMELDVRPGARMVEQIKIVNDSPEPQDITITPKDFAASSDPRSLGDAVEDGEFGAGDWLTPEVRDLRLAPFERVNFDLIIEPPVGAPAGTNLGALLIRSMKADGKPGTDDNEAGTVVIDALMQVFLTVAGPVDHQLEITEVETRDAYQFGSNRLVSWDVSFRNDGTVNEHVEGTLDVQSVFGTRAERIKIEPLLVLRGATRTVRIIWRDVPWVGAFTPKVVVRGDDARSLDRTGARTVILPWWVFPLLAVLVFGPILWMWLARRREWKHYLEHEGADDADDDEADGFDDPWDPAAPTHR